MKTIPVRALFLVRNLGDPDGDGDSSNDAICARRRKCVRIATALRLNRNRTSRCAVPEPGAPRRGSARCANQGLETCKRIVALAYREMCRLSKIASRTSDKRRSS